MEAIELSPYPINFITIITIIISAGGHTHRYGAWLVLLALCSGILLAKLRDHMVCQGSNLVVLSNHDSGLVYREINFQIIFNFCIINLRCDVSLSFAPCDGSGLWAENQVHR